MTKKQAEILRAEWAKIGNPACDHAVSSDEREMDYLTGASICVRCGAYRLLKSPDIRS